MLIIRLSRIGKKKHPTFRLIISEKTKDTKGDYLELLGSYNPHTNKADIKADRVKYWLEKGAKTSATVNNLLVNNKVIEGEKVKVFKPKKRATAESTEAKEATEEKKETKESAEAKKPTEKKEEVKEEKQEEKQEEKPRKGSPKEDTQDKKKITKEDTETKEKKEEVKKKEESKK